MQSRTIEIPAEDVERLSLSGRHRVVVAKPGRPLLTAAAKGYALRVRRGSSGHQLGVSDPRPHRR